MTVTVTSPTSHYSDSSLPPKESLSTMRELLLLVDPLIDAFPYQKDALVLSYRYSSQQRDNLLHSFLEHHRNKVPAAFKAIQGMLQWRASMDMTSAAGGGKETKAETEKEKGFKTCQWPSNPRQVMKNFAERGKIPAYETGMKGRNGEPVFFVDIKKVDIRNISRSDVVHFTIALCEAVFYKVEDSYPQAAKIILLVDYDGFSMWKSFSLSYTQTLLDILDRYYPARFDKVLMYNYPRVIFMAYKMVEPFLSDYAKSMMQFLDSKDPGNRKNELLQFFDEDNIPTFLGGKAQFAPPT